MYRYFPNADALLIASAMRAVDGFIDQLVAHVSGYNDPVTAVVESVAFGVEKLAGDPQLENLLTRRQDGEAVISLTSDTAVTFCLSVFHRLHLDWTLYGFDSTALNELAEMTSRTVHSMLTDAGQGSVILCPRMTSLAILSQQ